MRFTVLGTIGAFEEGRRLKTGGPKQRTVLALLIANVGSPVTTDSLIQGVYGDDAPPGARRSIQTYVSNLRSEFGGSIEPINSGYRLRADRSDVDAFVFEDTVVKVANGADPETRSTRLREALGLWRGHPYADVDGLASLTTEIGRLNELRARAIEDRIQADLELGRHRDLVAELDSLTEEYPLRERFRAQQMLALYRCGRQAEALRAYGRTRNYLVEEMGLDPSPELRELEQRILDQDPGLAFQSGPTVRQAAILAADVADPRLLSTLEPIDREALIQQQSEALDEATYTNGGEVFAHRGSAMYASFESVDGAVAASVAAQQELAEIGHPMRMGIAVGEVQVPSDGSLQGPPLTRAAQLVSAGHGGQVLLSPEANQALVDSGEAGWVVRSLGQHDVDGSGERRPVYQLVIDGLSRDYPPLQSEMLPPALPIDVRGLPGYELREPVGAGAFGVVHRAYQPSVGREVAVKIIRPEFANDPDFIRHFEVEAQLVARLEHPHIVPLHDYWRSPEGAYLVMRWLGGGTLEDRIGRGPLSIGEAAELLDQIAPALAFAHRYGVVHRDLKPSNILLDDEGAAYVSDFGIARLEANVEPGSVAGDISDLAAVVAAALHGQTSNAAVGQLLAKATAESSPYTDVGSFVEAWNRAVGDRPAPDHSATYTQTRNPYKGLHAFGELDAEDFYGRDAEIAEIIDTLREHQFVAVVGPSGIGKSSVTRAGAIPALRQGAIAGSENWLITDMMPGSYPFEELTAALMRVSVEPPRRIEEDLRSSARGLVRYVRRYLPEGSTLLLVIDQFEELFTLSTEAERTEFLAMLAATAADERSNIRVVVTMRADFFDRPLRFAELSDALREGTVPIAAPDRAALLAITAEPAHAVGVALEPGLAERIVAEVKDQPGALPLTQYAMAELFEARATDTLTNSEYDAGGGVLGALGARAESIYTSMNGAGQEATRQVLLRLVRVSEGGGATRRRVTLTELDGLPAGEGQVRNVLRGFAEYRLLAFDADDVSRVPTVEVAHEALLREWPRLSGWIDDLREDLILHARLAAAVADWEAAHRSDAFLLSGGRLTQHETWTAVTDLSLALDESEFLSVSRLAENAQLSRRRRTARLVTAGFAVAAVVGLALAALAMSAQSDAENQARIANARELAASAISVVDADPELATLLAIEAFDTAPGGSALFPEAMVALRRAMDANRLVARLETVSANDVAFTADGSGLIVVDTAARSVSRYEVAPDGLAPDPVWTYSDNTTTDSMLRVSVNPTRNMAAVLILDEYFGEVAGGEPDGPKDDGVPARVILLDSINGSLIGEVPMECAKAQWGPFFFSTDGMMLGFSQEALECADDPDWFGFTFIDVETMEVVARWDRVNVTMTEDMSAILMDAVREPAELRSFPEGELIQTFDFDIGSGNFDIGAGARQISPDGETIVFRADNTVDTRPGFWDVATNQRLAWGDSFDGFFNSAGTAYTAEGAVFAPSTESDVLYDPRTGEALLTLPTSMTHEIAVSPDGSLAATANSDFVSVWEIGPREDGHSLADSEAGLFWLNSDVIDEGRDTGIWGFIEIVDGFAWRYVVVEPNTGQVIAFKDSSFLGDQLPDGRVALAAIDHADPANPLDDVLGPLVIWDPHAGATEVIQDCSVPFEEMWSFPENDPWYFGDFRGAICEDGDFFFGYGLTTSTDGRYLAAIGLDPAAAPENPTDVNRHILLRIWDLESMAPLHTHELELEVALGHRPLAHFADDWLVLIDGRPGSGAPLPFKIVDVDTGEIRAELVDSITWRESIVVSSEGRNLYLVNEAGGIVEYDTESWMPLRRWTATDGRPRGLSLSPNDRFLVAGGEDEIVTIWDLEADQPLLVDRIPIGAWASDTTWITESTLGVAAFEPGSTVDWRTIDINPTSVLDAARDSVLRGFTEDECTLYQIPSCSNDAHS